MNCEELREQLIDLLYDELGEPRRAEALSHLDGCDACREELRRLQRARSALAEFRVGEPRTMSVLSGEMSRSGRLDDRAVPVTVPRSWLFPAGVRRWLAVGAGVAAAVLIVWAILMQQGTGLVPTASAQPTGPVEIKRLGISLTILSAPAESSGDSYEPVRQMLDYQIDVQVTMRQTKYRTPYQTELMPYGPGWEGLALVRDQRLAVNLKKGANEVRFKDVPAGIKPDTVRLRSLDKPDGLAILEQNYQYDLASAEAVLRKYVDKPITVLVKDLPDVTGDLLSFDDENLVVRPKGEGPHSVSREKVRAILFERLPEGLLSTPTLVWQLDNKAEHRQQFEVAYMTAGLSWRADYVLKLRPAARPAGAEKAPAGPQAADARDPAKGAATAPVAGLPEILDTAEIVGYATVTNRSGVTYENAQLKLMAGDVNLIQEEVLGQRINRLKDEKGANRADAAQFEEKSFFEYHLYTLPWATTIRNAETKQIALVSGDGIRMKRAYVYDPQRNATAAQVVSEFKNSENNGLGRPLPKGVIRLYAPDPEGVQTYVFQTNIDHTPVDEKVRLPWSYAFDIACTAKTAGSRTAGDERQETREYDLRNHKDYGVTLTAIFHIPRTAYEASCTVSGKDHPWHIREVGLVEVDVAVPANSAVKVVFSYKANTKTGGGLKSPWDREALRP